MMVVERTLCGNGLQEKGNMGRSYVDKEMITRPR